MSVVPPEDYFHSLRYLRSTARRLEHLAMLGLPLRNRSVLELGAGIGDLTSFFLDRGCRVTSVEKNASFVARFRERYSADPLWPEGRLAIVESAIEDLADHDIKPHEIVFCYGLLNEIGDAEAALDIFARYCTDLLIVESAVHSGPGFERAEIYTKGGWSLPTRPWLHDSLTSHFPHVYSPVTQPSFDRYRADWSRADEGRGQHRVIFIASRSELENALLCEGLPDVYGEEIG